jgi:hypothetical protein
MKVKCEVIGDLLPLYIDEVCSKESKMIVEEHIKECRLCYEKLRIQESEMIVDVNSINENLKSKEPFKRIKKSYAIRLIAILASIPLLFLIFVDLRGDGVGFGALSGKYKAERFLSSVEKGEFVGATRYMVFQGGKYGKMGSEDLAKTEWVAGMQELKKDGIEIVSHRENRIVTDDSFTSGYVNVSVEYQKKTYDFMLYISTNNGRVEPGHLEAVRGNQVREENEVEKMLIERLSNVISTYNPG